MRKGANRQANPTHDVAVCVTPADICQLTGVKGAARILDRSEDTVITYADRGLLACARDTTGKRLFRVDDVEQFKRQLDQSQSQTGRKALALSVAAARAR